MMVYWVFTEEQLQLAMRAYARRLGETGAPVQDFQVVHDFLRSPEALLHKLRVEDKSRG
jgi:hypothetical protein